MQKYAGIPTIARTSKIFVRSFEMWLNLLKYLRCINYEILNVITALYAQNKLFGYDY